MLFLCYNFVGDIMNHKYIDKNTFEIVDNVFEVDEEIAETISILNKKGYYTEYCCGGHIKDPRVYEMYKLDNEDEEIKFGYVVDKSDKVDVLLPQTFAGIYIKFRDKINFKIPDGFTLYEDDTIDKVIDFYCDGKKKSWKEIDKELDNARKILLDWANNLLNK